jgi:hypothetical protein
MPCVKKPEEKSGGWKRFTKEGIENVETHIPQFFHDFR